MSGPKHGEERNRRTVTTEGSHVEYVDQQTGATVYDGPLTTTTRTAAEKWCAWCREWIDIGKLGFAGWVIGWMICPKCNHGWDEAPEDQR